jgi:hypothetical protein
VAAVARAGPHRRMKDDEVVAHYARAADGSPGVIRLVRLAETRESSADMTMHPRNQPTNQACCCPPPVGFVASIDA